MSFLPVTCDAARGLQCPKETRKRCTENRCTSFKPTRTNVDRTWSFFRTFCCGKMIYIAGNTVVYSCLKIRNNDDRDFPPKMTFIRRLEIFREFGMCSKSLGTNWTPRQKRVQLERLGGWGCPFWFFLNTDGCSHVFPGIRQLSRPLAYNVGGSLILVWVWNILVT